MPLRYGVAGASVALALGLKLLLDPLMTQHSPFLLLAGAVMIAAWFGGLGPGLLATALGAMTADYLFLSPVGSFTGLVGKGFLPLFLFVLQGALIASLAHALDLARQKAEASRLEALSNQEKLAERERELHDLVGRLIVAQEEERRRVAYEVHDGFTQMAAAASTGDWHSLRSIARRTTRRTARSWRMPSHSSGGRSAKLDASSLT